MLIEMPELDTLSRKQAASLAGLAPISRQSGKWQGKERIQGGHASLRRAVYLPAVVADRFNPDMKAKYQEQITNGKMQETGNNSSHAQTCCHGKRVAPRWTKATTTWRACLRQRP
jgi:transposase